MPDPDPTEHLEDVALMDEVAPVDTLLGEEEANGPEPTPVSPPSRSPG